MKPVILIVEDNLMSLRLVSEILKWQECEVLEAGDAEGALALIQQRVPDLLLLDLGLPKMDGLALVRLLRADPRTAALPIVALTAHAMSKKIEEAYAAGCTGYITKPINTRELYKQVTGFLGKTTASASGADPAAEI